MCQWAADWELQVFAPTLHQQLPNIHNNTTNYYVSFFLSALGDQKVW